MEKTAHPQAWLRGLVSGFAVLMLLASSAGYAEDLSLPPPSRKGTLSVEEALSSRRTHRSFQGRALTLKQLSQILWAANGVTAVRPGRQLKTAPSAGATYPIDIYAVVGEGGVESMAPGVYHYRPESHSLRPVTSGDVRTQVAAACLRQMWMAPAPLLIVITGEYGRCSAKYGPRGVTYTQIEAGHVGQNVFLQAEALFLKAGIVGAFEREDLGKTLHIPAAHEPLLVMPVGYPG
ncbi:MAG: nitroreductase [Deltaproteobacteria bacterium]|jgi:SagB-type dehydrogenase family enzyme|nr:nitroreductase [Deltaproteobacteria bacterium]